MEEKEGRDERAAQPRKDLTNLNAVPLCSFTQQVGKFCLQLLSYL